MSDRYSQSNQLIERALKVIPTGSQTFSKSITQYPRGASPLFLEKGKGGHVWDVDGNEYIDFVNALSAVTLGYCDPDVEAAVCEQLKNGVTFSLPHRLEMEVAELLVELIPCAEMVRFGKNGTDVTSASIRLARAYTGKERVLVSGYHGWQDWYIGTTTRDLGVPGAVKELTGSFEYNKIESLQAAFDEAGGDVACVIMEPMNFYYPEADFLKQVKQITHANQALLIFDEMVTGGRFGHGGAQELFGVTPDLATFGKGIANGFPLSAIVGTRDVMMKMEDIFFSGTFGGETLSLAAAKVVLNKILQGQVIEGLHETGRKLTEGVKAQLDKHELSNVFDLIGHPVWTLLTMSDHEAYSSWEIRTYFYQEMFKRGILTLGTHNLTSAHSDADLKLLFEAYDEVFAAIATAFEKNDLNQRIQGEVLKPLFRVRN